MINKLNQQSRKIYRKGKAVANELNHQFLGAEHLLYGLLEYCDTKSVLEKNGISKDYLDNLLYVSPDDMIIEEINNVEVDILPTPHLRSIISSANTFKSGEKISPIELLFAISITNGSIAFKILNNKRSLVDDIHNLYEHTAKKASYITEEEYISDFNINESAPTLAKYGVDLTSFARSGEIGEVFCRQSELKNIIQVLSRKKKSNPCLVGYPGVGKTAIVEALAHEIVKKNVPKDLLNSVVVSLDIGSLISGAKYRGEFESRLDTILSEINNNSNIILFIDEFHNIASLGGNEGALSAGEILKPALARGKIKCIGATTFNEYQKFIEKDKALERRFQKIVISEPSKEDTLKILSNVKKSYENHHNIAIPNDILNYIVEVSGRYISDRFFPDKAFDLLDDVCSYARVNGNDIKINTKIVDKIIFNWIGIPVNNNNKDSKSKILGLKNTLSSSIIGQDNAIERIFKSIAISYAGLKSEDKPLASFVFCGPTGVGKTETAKILANEIMGRKDSLIRLDMSEYMEKHSVSKLIGSAPGYIGYEEGGILTEAVKRNPYSVILFDEIENAHTDVANILLQILDYGSLTDSKGRKVNFTNSIIILTSNVFEEKNANSKSIGFFSPQDNEDILDRRNVAVKSLIDKFSPEFVGRFDDIIVFNSINDNVLDDLISKELNSLKNKIEEKDIIVTINKGVKEYLLDKCVNKNLSARNIKSLIEREILSEISIMILEGGISPNDSIKVSFEKEQIKITKVIRKNRKSKEVQVGWTI